MSALRYGISLSRNSLFKGKVQQKVSIIVGTMMARNLSTMQVTKNMMFISDKKFEGNISNLQLVPADNKPLVIMLPWLLAEKKHVNKYAEIYTSKGFNVLSISLTPWQLLWPAKGTQLVANDVLKFITTNTTNAPLFLHGFSVGAYMWGEVLVKMAAELPKYQPVIDRVVGQIWDSAADITEIPVGMPIAVFPKNVVMQKALRKYILYHMKTFHKVATVHYLRSSQMFHTNIIRAPALFFLSKTDPIGAESSNQRVRENWESMGMQVYWKCWDKSPHVGHFARHAEEYKAEWMNFFDKVYGEEQRQCIQAKL